MTKIKKISTKAVKPSVKGSMNNKLVKRMNPLEIWFHVYSGNLPMLSREQAIQMNADILYGTEPLGMGKIQVAVTELLRINLIKVGVHPEDADELINVLPDGWDGTNCASELLYEIFSRYQSEYLEPVEAA